MRPRVPTASVNRRGCRASVLAATLLAVMSLGSCGDDGDDVAQRAGGTDGASTSTTGRAAVAAGSTIRAGRAVKGSWSKPGGTDDNARAAAGAAIDSSNVDQLDVAWTAPLTSSLSTTPLVADGTVYIQDGSGVVAAIDAATGVDVWRTEPFGAMIGPYGVALEAGRVFAMYGTKGVVALDAADGTTLWSRELTSTPTEGVGLQPAVVDGVVLASTIPVSIDGVYTGGDRGVLHGLDAVTGDVLWTFDTVESPDLWGHPEINSGGGAWYTPSYDDDRGLVYWGVGNPAPFPGTDEFPNGTSRPGDNRYTDSIVATDLHTGELSWFHQVTPHDLFDRDLIHTLIARPTGRGPVVVTTGKAGLVVGIDPDSHVVLWTAPVGRHQNDDLAELDGPTEIYPGTFGGVLTPPSTADGFVYLPVINAPTVLEPDKASYIGSQLGTNDGEIVAIDAASGAEVWSTEVPGDPLGATTVVNDLVLTTLLGGDLLALDRSDGSVVWSAKLPGGTNGWMAAVDDLLFVPVGNASPPQLVAYRLP